MDHHDEDVFTVSVRHLANADVISVDGVLDVFSAPKLQEVLLGATSSQARHLVLDLSSLGFLDSIGVNTIIANRGPWGARQGRTVVVVLPGTSPHKILDILALNEVIEIFPSMEAAEESLGTGTLMA
jgi:anti-sigma B factor antagonist